MCVEMRSNSSERDDIRAKEEGDHRQNTVNVMEQQSMHISDRPQSSPSSSLSTRQWTSAFRNPRIVRVSRTFGGKDRHSKVCTVRGLRDRRIRLSVPTAIQLYDLQDRLGLSQPSKVIDWLLEAAKDDVDKLPPLQLPQGFGQLYPNLMLGSSYGDSLSGNSLGFFDNWDTMNIGGGNSSRTRSETELGLDKGKWIKFDDHGDHRQHDHNSNRDHHRFYSSSGQSSGTSNKFYPTLLNNPTTPAAAAYNSSSYFHLDPSNLSLSHFGHVHQQPQESGNVNTVAGGIGGGSQLFVCPPAATMSSFFPTYPSFLGNSSHQDGSHHHHPHLQLLGSSNSSSQQILSGSRPFHQLMNVNPGFSDMQRDSQENNDNDSD